MIDHYLNSIPRNIYNNVKMMHKSKEYKLEKGYNDLSTARSLCLPYAHVNGSMCISFFLWH